MFVCLNHCTQCGLKKQDLLWLLFTCCIANGETPIPMSQIKVRRLSIGLNDWGLKALFNTQWESGTHPPLSSVKLGLTKPLEKLRIGSLALAVSPDCNPLGSSPNCDSNPDNDC